MTTIGSVTPVRCSANKEWYVSVDVSDEETGEDKIVAINLLGDVPAFGFGLDVGGVDRLIDLLQQARGRLLA